MYLLNWWYFDPVLIDNLIKDIECPNLISTRYLSEIDEALVFFLNFCPSFATGAYSVLHLSDNLAIHHHPRVICGGPRATQAVLVLQGLIFSFICDDVQRTILRSFMIRSLFHRDVRILLFDFLSNSQRSQHHAVDNKMRSSVTERCFSYILNHRPAHFPGVRCWARRSIQRPWLWRWRKPKGVITNFNSQFRWQQDEYMGCTKRLQLFWAVVLALKYLPCLLDKATRSEELIALSKMWLYRPFFLSLFPHDAKKVGKAVKHYLSRFGKKEECESVVVGPPLLCIV